MPPHSASLRLFCFGMELYNYDMVSGSAVVAYSVDFENLVEELRLLHIVLLILAAGETHNTLLVARCYFG